MTALPPKAEVHPPSCYVAEVPGSDICGAASLGSIWVLAIAAPRQAHGEHRALARLARDGHVPAHHAREFSGDGETQAGAAEALRGGGISLAKLLEQLCLLLRGHADA